MGCVQIRPPSIDIFKKLQKTGDKPKKYLSEKIRCKRGGGAVGGDTPPPAGPLFAQPDLTRVKIRVGIAGGGAGG